MNGEPVLDSSALLAVILNEPGADRVRDRLAESRVSAVTVTETIEVLTRKGDTCEGAQVWLHRIVAAVEPFGRQQAETDALLLTRHRRNGLSLGDAACLALALHLQAEVLTADRVWATLGVPVPVTLIR